MFQVIFICISAPWHFDPLIEDARLILNNDQTGGVFIPGGPIGVAHEKAAWAPKNSFSGVLDPVKLPRLASSNFVTLPGVYL
ncbi:hypothetical protein U1Q18_022468 [Sarracenia purpurea var. burkii]